MNLTSPSVLKNLMSEHGIQFNKAFGQNFLISPDTVWGIVDGCGADPVDAILEIGPGVGTLTQALCETYSKVVSVEIDRGLIPVLEETVGGYENFTLINNDILKVDLHNLFEEHFSGKNVCVCANLPYYITTPIIMYLLESGLKFKAITVMVQKEVADRLVSLPGKSGYGAITAAVNRYGTVKKILTVKSGNFMPAPKVDSAVISIIPYDERPYSVKDEIMLTDVINGAFSQRRKTLVNSLASCFPYFSKDKISEIVINCGFDPNIRGETLGIEDFAKISDAFTDEK